MVRQAPLRKIVGADALRAIAAADQTLARRRLFGVLFAPTLIFDTGHENAHSLITVLVLRSAILTFDDGAGRQVRDADSRISFVNVLSTGARCTEGIDTQIGRIDRHRFQRIRFRHHRHGARRGVDTSLRFGFGHALHAVTTRFELERRIGALPNDAENDFLIPAQIGFTG